MPTGPVSLHSMLRSKRQRVYRALYDKVALLGLAEVASS
jgi:hypothetical protein